MFLIRTCCVAVLFLFPFISLAQSEIDTVLQLSEVTVISDRYREIIPSQRLSGEKLEALGSFSVADAIRYFSGVQIKDYGGVGGLKTVDIRSMGTHHMGVFYDGVQIGNAQNGQVDLGKFSLDNIEEISLYNGQKSEIFQPAKDFGSAGSIYLRTRRPRFTDGKKSNLKTSFRTGSFDLVNPSLLWEQKLSDNVSLSFNTEYIYSSGKYKFRSRKVYHNGTVAWDTTSIRRNGEIHSLRLESGINGFIEQGKWNVKVYFYNSDKGIPGAIVNNVEKNSQWQNDVNFFTQFSFQKKLFPKYDLQLNVKYTNDKLHYIDFDTIPSPFPEYNLALGSFKINNTFLQQEIYASIANRYAILPNWDINLSADYQWNNLDANLINFVYPRRHTALAALATAFEWKCLKAQASFLSTFVFDRVTRTKEHEKMDNKQEYTPAVFLSCTPFVKANHYSPLRLHAFYKRIFRMPTFNDLYYTELGNITLRPEYAVQYNLGFQYNKNFDRKMITHLNFRADAYYNEITDKIVAIPKGEGQYRWMMMNLGRVEIRGVDVSAQVEARTGTNTKTQCIVSLQVNYTYQKAQDFSRDPIKGKDVISWGKQIAYIPWHSGSAILNVKWKSCDLNYSFIYVGERYHNSANIRENYERPWYTSDLTIGKTFNYRKMKFKLSVEANNILDQQYEVVVCYPMPGRNYKLILKMEI
jgi:outer membrane cobalamin receptor